MKGKAAETFEELHIYQRARELTNAVYAISKDGNFTRDYGLSDQIRRAAVSTMSNIAEGFERGTTTEFIQFLYIAKGSCGEVRAQLQIALDQCYIATEAYQSLIALARRTSSMISSFISHLQSSDYRGRKSTGSQRQAVESQQQRMASLRDAQLANIRHQQSQPTPEAPAG